MMERELDQIDKDILVRLAEYCKYLYEEEKERTNRLNDAVKVYIAFLTLILGFVVFKLLPPEKVLAVFNKISIDSNFRILGIMLISISFIMFIISFVFTILVLKVWRFERLCNPKEVALKSAFMESENKLLSVIIADYIIAANRNYDVNDKKAKLLSKALFSLVAGLIFFAISSFSFNWLVLWRGGM